MWLIPLLVLGAVAIAAASRSREPSRRQLPPPAPPALPPGSPIAVIGEFVRAGQMPPPPVVLCALAEAEALGRDDLASDIVRAFVAPVVYQHVAQQAIAVPPPAPLPPPPVQLPAARAYERGACSPRNRSPRAEADAASAARIPQTDAEIQALINADPAGFLAAVARATAPRPVIDVPSTTPPPQPPAPPVVIPAPHAPPPPTGLPPEVVAQMQEAAGLPEAADQTRAIVPGSPIAGIADDAWRQFVICLSRESPTFSSSRHVGQYRQRRERLAELNIDPGAIHGSAQAQRAAIDVDLVDAYDHATKGGLVEDHLDRAIAVPGLEGDTRITLSGILGVIQCAGLEGAVGWLERSSDRKRYPNTTQAFLRSNGVF